MEESTEAKLLRLLIGYVHVLTMQSYALGTENKPIYSLSLEEKAQLENRMMIDVIACARDVNPTVLAPILPIKREVH